MLQKINATGYLISLTVGISLLVLSVLMTLYPPLPAETGQIVPNYTVITSPENSYSHLQDNFQYPEPEPTTPTQPKPQVATVRLGGLGGQKQVDRCDGSFIEIESYRIVQELQPTYSAHNGCGGGAILPLQVGSQLFVNGDKYVVVSLRDLPKTSKVSQIVGMDGDIILQTCYWRSNTMKFIGIEKIH